MPESSPNLPDPTWWDIIPFSSFDDAGFSYLVQQGVGLMFVCTDLTVSKASGDSGTGFYLLVDPPNTVWFQAASGAGSADCFQWHGYMPFGNGRLLLGQADTGSNWNLCMSGFWVPDYTSDLL